MVPIRTKNMSFNFLETSAAIVCDVIIVYILRVKEVVCSEIQEVANDTAVNSN